MGFHAVGLGFINQKTIEDGMELRFEQGRHCDAPMSYRLFESHKKDKTLYKLEQLTRRGNAHKPPYWIRAIAVSIAWGRQHNHMRAH
jgi:hypothetical protein